MRHRCSCGAWIDTRNPDPRGWFTTHLAAKPGESSHRLVSDESDELDTQTQHLAAIMEGR